MWKQRKWVLMIMFTTLCFITLGFSFTNLGEDYSVASSDVVLLEGETSKAVPIYIINDINPELEESFYVQLLNQTTGGALLGSLTRAVITIEASDDPFGSFGKRVHIFFLLLTFFLGICGGAATWLLNKNIQKQNCGYRE